LAQPVAKVRSRRDGSAVPLDELDKRLLNLLQGSFPIAPRPYEHVAGIAGVAEDEVLARTKHLLDERIIREVTPIFDTRVLGYSSMLVAAKVDSVRQLPTLRLFKIRMDLEMEKGTETLAAAAEAVDHREPEAIELSDLDVAVIRATQGPMEVLPEPFAPAAAELGMSQEALLAHLESMQERRALRRVAAILFHRRAGFSANGMGVWRVPEERILELGPRMASFRGISHCYQRPTYADWPYSVFTMAHGRSKEECDAILDSIAEDTGIEDRRTLYSSTEFKKCRLRYFTDEHKRWEAEHA